jgi:IS5 family transposase
MRRQKEHQQLSFGDGLIDPSLYQLDEELTEVDRLLSTEELIKPFEAVFDPVMGRPGTPVDVYLRMMYLKFRWRLSYEEVEREVRERIPWRHFCHLSLQESVPDSTTLIKLNQRFGDALIGDLNKKLVKHLVKTKAITPRKIRIDSTTVEAHISYPTDMGLIHQTVKTLTRSAASLGHKITNHVRATKKAVARLGASLKSKSKGRKQQLHKTLRAVAKLAAETVQQSRAVVDQLSNQCHPATVQVVERFKQQIALATQILQQTEQKLGGRTSIPHRIVSFHDPEAAVIRKGKLGKPNEFGRTLQIVQDDSGIILDMELHQGNPSDKTLLVPLVKRFKKRFGHAPAAIAADKGYYSADNLISLKHMKVPKVGIAKIGRLKPLERRRQKSKWFKGLQRFRCGIEATISILKRCFSLGDVLSRGSPHTKTWVAFSVFSYNLWKLAR